jgi:hypothetical protein
LVFAQPGDADGDGLLNTTDLVKVFQAREFEDGIRGGEGAKTFSTNHETAFRQTDGAQEPNGVDWGCLYIS